MNRPSSKSDLIAQRTAGFRRRYPFWLLFAIIAGIVTGAILQTLEVRFVIPVWQVYLTIIAPLVFFVSIPHLIYFSSQSRVISTFLSILVLLGAILSLIGSFLAL